MFMSQEGDEVNRAERRALKHGKTRAGGYSYKPGRMKFATYQEKTINGKRVVVVKEAK